MKAKIAVLPGDGIGPEVTAEAVRVLEKIAMAFDHSFELAEADIGGIAIDKTGKPLPDATWNLCEEADAVLMGAVGGPKWDNPRADVRPEQGLLEIRKRLGLFANLRPVKIHPELRYASPLKPELLKGVDLLVVRELAGGIYYGAKVREKESASDTCTYSVAEIERVTHVACKMAQKRKGRLVSVDKANVLETSRLWRSTVESVVARDYPKLQLEHVLVDSMAMFLIKQPAKYDVVLTENMFGDILTDEASVLTGSMGLLPSASLGAGKRGLYEPIHGSAPDITGKGIANPYAAILSAALLLRYSLGLETEASAVEGAVYQGISEGVLTRDLATDISQAASTREVGDVVIGLLEGIGL